MQSWHIDIDSFTIANNYFEFFKTRTWFILSNINQLVVKINGISDKLSVKRAVFGKFGSIILNVLNT